MVNIVFKNKHDKIGAATALRRFSIDVLAREVIRCEQVECGVKTWCENCFSAYASGRDQK
jgi:hypothetical protein